MVPLTLHTALLSLATVKTTAPPPEAMAPLKVSGVPTVPVVGGDDQVMVCAVNPAVTVIVFEAVAAE